MISTINIIMVTGTDLFRRIFFVKIKALLGLRWLLMFEFTYLVTGAAALNLL
jgi:hypothetical protein